MFMFISPETSERALFHVHLSMVMFMLSHSLVTPVQSKSRSRLHVAGAGMLPEKELNMLQRGPGPGQH